MDKEGTLYTSCDHYGNFCALKVLIAANYSGAKVDVDQKFVFGDTNKSEEFLKKFPSGKVPAFESKDKKVHLTESDAIAYYVSDDTLKGGKDEDTKAQVLQWLSFAQTELLPGVRGWHFPSISMTQFNKDHFARAKTEFERLLHDMDNYLLDHTYLVGECITLADISVFTILFHTFKHLLHARNRILFVNVSRWFDTIFNEPKVKDIISKAKLSSYYCITPVKFDSANLKEITGGQTHTAAKKPENNEEETPKAAEPKPKEPEPVAEEMDEAEAPLEAEPKSKDPLVALPKRTLVMDDFKRFDSKNHTRQGVFKCTKCSKQFKSNSKLKRHMITHTKERKFICTICKYPARCKSSLRYHTIGVHSNERAYKCEKCGKQFGWNHHLKAHMRIHKGDFGVLLKIHDIGDLVNNLRLKYGSGSCNSDGWNPIKIEDTPELMKHIELKCTTKPFHCTKCGHLSGTKGDLKLHMKIHTNLKEYKCYACGKEFRHKTSLFEHIRTHTGERPYKCPLCTKTFTQSRSMKVHLNIRHIKEKPWKCEVCDVDFTSNNGLYRHKKSKKCIEAYKNIQSSK